MAYDIGQPVGQYYNYDYGQDPAYPGNPAMKYVVVARKYGNALVLFKPKYSWATAIFDSRSVTVNNLGGNYRPLNIDGTLGGATSTISLKNWDAAILIPADPPTVPSGLSASVISTSQINLSWASSTDNEVSVAGYRIYRGGARIATTSSISYSDTNLSASTLYSYTIAAYDSAGNVSASSTAASATTQTDTDITPPTFSLIATSSIAQTSATITWTTNESATSSVKYGTSLSYTLASSSNIYASSSPSHSITLHNLNSGTQYHFQVASADRSGNRATSSDLTFTTTAVASLGLGNIDATYYSAWSKNAGWLDFGTTAGNVIVTNSNLTGYVWGENVGWINLNPAIGGVTNNINGNLSGAAWGENVGWIFFGPLFGNAKINYSGEFIGMAWGENVGWINFNCSNTNSCATVNFKVKTSWVPVVGATYTIGGSISGLSGTVVLQNNSSDNKSISAVGSFTFATAINNGASYSVTVITNPSGQTCAVSSGSGNVSGANVTTVLISCANNAVVTPSSTGGGGGGSITITAPNAPTNFNAASSAGQINLSWTNPTSNFSGIKLYRKTNSALTGQTDTAAKLIYQGSAQNFTDASTTLNTLYYYSLYFYNSSLYYSQPNTVFIYLSAALPISTSSAPIIAPAVNSSGTPANISSGNSIVTTLINAASAIVEQVTAEETANLLVNPQFAPLTDVENKIYASVVALITKPLNQNTKYAIADFIHTGTPTTLKLGAGERAGSIASFNSAFGKMPTTNADWQDVIKIGNGRWTTQTSAAAEARAKISFKKIYLRAPNMINVKDNAAVTVMAYGLRPAARNTKSERAAINSFKYIFHKTPVSAIDWDIVRAIAYSGAKR
jgi:chitodextrinase